MYATTFVGEDGVRYENGRDDLGPYYGKELDFYGADPLDKRFQLGTAVFALIEDNTGCDEYHGPTLGAVVIEPNHSPKIGRHKISRVRVERKEISENQSPTNFGFEVRLVDVQDGHAWVEYSEKSDGYYAIIEFYYNPKADCDD